MVREEDFSDPPYNHLKRGTFDEDEITHEKIKYLPTSANCFDISRHPVIQSLSYLKDYDLTLAAFYPAGGFIGWHTNSNFERYNAIITFSDTGDGYFEYVDPDSGKIIKVDDKPGMTIKKTRWTHSNPIWHRAYTNCRRITICLSSRSEEKIDDLIKNINSQ